MVLVRTGYRMRLAGAGVAVALSFFLLADEQFITQTADHYQRLRTTRHRSGWLRGGAAFGLPSIARLAQAAEDFTF